jgi:CubicO group peptidase (beta-lactamase class C family)
MSEPTGTLSRSKTAALDAIFEPANRTTTPGLVVGVARHGRVVYRRGFGMASLEHAVANTPATKMRIGSTSKHFTSLAVLLLAEDGKLDIDAPANTYLPELPQLQGMPTVRQFMNHTSGYHCSLSLSFIANGLAPPPKGWASESLFRQKGVNFAPGEAQTYCNGGYHLLSLIVDRVSGQPFEDFAKERIFDVLGMNDTAYVTSDMKIVPGMATLHVPQPDGSYRRGIFPSEEIRGEGAVVSTVDDMLLWLRHLNGPKRVGSDDSWRQMLEPTVLSNGAKSIYGLGLHRHAYRGVEIVHHAGAVIGGGGQMLTVPAHGLDVIIYGNGGPVNPIASALKVVDAVLEDVLTDAAPAAPSAEAYKHLAGERYIGKSGVTVAFGVVGEDLGLSFLGEGAMPVLKVRGGRLVAGWEDVALGPLEFDTRELAPTPDGGAPDAITFWESGSSERLERVAEDPPKIEDLAPTLLGEFRCEDLAADATLFERGNDLIIRLKGPSGSSESRLEAVTGRSLIAWSLEARGSGSSILIDEPESGLVRAFTLETSRARHLRFERLQ